MQDVHVLDEVAVVIRGDTFVSMWKGAALLNRVRWHGALLEQHVAKHRGSAGAPVAERGWQRFFE